MIPTAFPATNSERGAATGQEAVFGSSHVRRYVMGALFAVAFLNIAVRVCISAAKIEMSRDLGINDMTFGVVFGAFALGYAVFMVPSGWLADRWGPRKFLAVTVLLWSLFTACTGIVYGTAALMAVRLLFGIAEAGTFPTATRAIHNWIPARERGFALGLLNMGSRLGAALALVVMPLSIARFGWRITFLLLGIVGGLWAAIWFIWFRDDPQTVPWVTERELAYICQDRAPSISRNERIDWRVFLLSRNLYLILFQYFASSFTFFICFSWLLPYMTTRYGITANQAGKLASIPLFCGALATWISGVAVDFIYRRGHWKLSRALPAMFGFALATVTVVVAASMPSAITFIFCFSLTTFGVDLTLSPSWTVCCDVGVKYSGTLSAAMNMMGSFGSLTCSLLFPFMLTHTGSAKSYFCLAAFLNILAMICWRYVQPEKQLQPN